MKILQYLLLTLLSVGMISACDVSQVEDEIQEDQAQSITPEETRRGHKWGSKFKKRVPFVVKFISEGGVQPGAESVEVCGQPPLFLNVQNGDGVGTYLGHFSYSATFCVDGTDLLDDGMLTGDESIPYFDNENTTSIMTAENGDQLIIGIRRGTVVPATTPGFDFEFHDTFIITGGTGKFEGARGWGKATGLTTQSPERTEHIWTGRIKLKNKKHDWDDDDDDDWDDD